MAGTVGPGSEAPHATREQELVGKAIAGDAEARSRLVEDARGQVYRWCCGLLSDADQAEDATQETLLRVWQHIGHLRDARAYPAWLYRITLHACQDRGGMRQASPVSDEQAAPAAGSPDVDPAGIVAAREELSRMLACLSSSDADVLRMRYGDQLSAREVGETLHISEGAVRTRLYALKQRLRQGLRRP